MSGKRYFLDTNTVIQLLKGNSEIVVLLENAEFVGMSVISRLEFLAFSGLSEEDKSLYNRFEKRVSIIDLSQNDRGLLDKIIEVRTNSSLKLPDAIILSSADMHDCILLTADKKLMAQEYCECLNFEII